MKPKGRGLLIPRRSCMGHIKIVPVSLFPFEDMIFRFSLNIPDLFLLYVHGLFAYHCDYCDFWKLSANPVKSLSFLEHP